MPTSDFVKKTDTELIIQLNDFATRLPIHAAVVGVTAGEQTAAVNDAAMFQFYINLLGRSDDYKKLLVANKDRLKNGPIGASTPPGPDVFDPGAGPTTVPPGIIPRFRILAKKIKASPNYNPGIGESLGIVAPVFVPDLNPKPVLNGLSLPNWHVQIGFKKGKYSGIYIEMKRGAGDWTFLDRALKSKYIDTKTPLTAGQPEERRYRARFLNGNDPLGQWSDEIIEVANS